MRSLQTSLAEFDARGVRLAAISVDPPEVTRAHRHKLGFTFTFLADTTAEVIRRYDLAHPGGGPEGTEIARPAEFYVDSSGIVRWVNLTTSYAVRATPERILKAIDSAVVESGGARSAD